MSLPKLPKMGSVVRAQERYSAFAVHLSGIVDAFWAQELSTVRANLPGAKQLEETGDTLGMVTVRPTMGPYSEEDTFGMLLAVCIVENQGVHSVFDGQGVMKHLLQHLSCFVTASNRDQGHGSEHYSDMGHYLPMVRVLV
jgi:hypothetical protein